MQKLIFFFCFFFYLSGFAISASLLDGTWKTERCVQLGSGYAAGAPSILPNTPTFTLQTQMNGASLYELIAMSSDGRAYPLFDRIDQSPQYAQIGEYLYRYQTKSNDMKIDYSIAKCNLQGSDCQTTQNTVLTIIADDQLTLDAPTYYGYVGCLLSRVL